MPPTVTALASGVLLGALLACTLMLCMAKWHSMDRAKEPSGIHIEFACVFGVLVAVFPLLAAVLITILAICCAIL